MTLLNDCNFYVFDTETTGLHPESDKVVEVACIVVRPKDFTLWGWSSLVDPGIEIPPEASAIHHITDPMVHGKTGLNLALQELGNHLVADNLPVPPEAYVAHNAEFDSAFLPSVKRAPWLCTLRLARHLYPELDKYTNQYLRYYFKIWCPEVEGKSSHRALEDAYVTARVLKHLLKNIPEDWPNNLEDLIEKINMPILQRTCKFRAHDGKPWSEVPKDYLRWLLENKNDMDVDTRYTVSYYYQR